MWKRRNGDEQAMILRLRGCLFSAVGAGVLIGSYWIEGLQTATAPPWYSSSIVVGVGRTGGAALMIFGILNVLLEIPSTITYVQRRLNETLTAYTPTFSALAEVAASREVQRVPVLMAIKRTDPQRLDELRLNLLHVYHDMEYREAGAFSNVLRDEIEPLLGAPHYDRMSIHIHNDVQSANGVQYIRSRRTKSATVHCMNNGTIPIGVKNMHRPIEGFAPEELYRILELRVDGSLVATPEIVPVEKNGFYVVDYPLTVDIASDTSVAVSWDEEILLPVNDIIRWSVGGGRSLKALDVVCDFNQAVFPQITAHGFGTTLSVSEIDKSCTLSFSGWMLPYQGFVIAWTDPYLVDTGASLE